MSLINIEYGSLASSETLNTNFSYLEDELQNAVSAINTSISSIISNIATINSRLGDLSEEIAESMETCATNLSNGLAMQTEETRVQLNKMSMLPDWLNCAQISLESSYTTEKNGYLIIALSASTEGELIVNGKSIELQTGNMLVSLPLREGDIVTSTLAASNAYFLPSLENPTVTV